MKTWKKSLIALAILALAALAAWWGVNAWKRHVLEVSERRATEVMDAYFKLSGDGFPDEKAKVALKALFAEMAELEPKCLPYTAESLLARRMDGAFIIGDYETAVALMDRLPGYSDAWKKGAKAKVRAHAAEERGDFATAYREFSVFVDSMLADDADLEEVDPYTNVRWTRDGLLGRNYKRLADLAGKLGRGVDATNHLAAAKRHYQLALKDVEEGDDASRKELLKDAGNLLK